MRGTTRWAALWLALISGAIWLTIGLSLVLFPLWVRYDGLATVAGMSADRLYHNYLVLMRYLHLPWVRTLTLPDFPVSVSGARHFADVKQLFLLDIVIFLGMAPIAVRWVARVWRERERWRFVRPFSIAAAVPFVLGGLMAINFDAVFVAFHRVLFRNDDWLFDPVTDPIINVLPEGFFAGCFGLALVLFEAVMAWGIITGRRDAQLPGDGQD